MKLSYQDLSLIDSAISTWMAQCLAAMEDQDTNDEDYAELANDLTAMESLQSRVKAEIASHSAQLGG